MVSCHPQMVGKILLVLMLSRAQANQANGGMIRGQILVPSVRAYERIQVIIQKSDGPIVARIFSDTLGHFEVRNLASGNYDVLVNLEGYEEVRQQVGVAGGGSFNVVTLNIPLREKEKTILIKPDGGAADDIVDIAELGRKYPRRALQDYEKAVEEIHKANDAKAVELLEGVVKLAPDFYSARNTLGTLYQKTSRFREAETEYRRAHELNPRSADPLVNMGSLFIDEAAGRAKEGEDVVGKILDGALDTLEEALKIKRSAMAYYFLGTAYYKSSFYEEAETNFKHALEMEQHLPVGRLMLANLYMKQQKWQDALEHLDAYLSENPNTADRAQIQDTRSQVAQRIK
jgi:Tfp pilus assembly protein PilF